MANLTEAIGIQSSFKESEKIDKNACTINDETEKPDKMDSSVKTAQNLAEGTEEPNENPEHLTSGNDCEVTITRIHTEEEEIDEEDAVSMNGCMGLGNNSESDCNSSDALEDTRLNATQSSTEVPEKVISDISILSISESRMETEKEVRDTDSFSNKETENLEIKSSNFSANINIPLVEETVKSNNASSCSTPPSPHNSTYHVKWIKWKDNRTAIITQNENGPCPLIAIINVLILKGKIHLPPMIEMITAGQLMEYLGDCILEYIPKNISEAAQLNYEQNMHDAMAIFPKLQTGLDVNVRFSGVNDFEYTPECIIFDLLHIPLYHGWLVDPQMPDVVIAIGNNSYNQLVEKIIIDKSSPNSEVVTNALIAETFLERTASQLTYHGLCELSAAIKEEELSVLFRNNHFSTVYKHKKELFQLVTDQGFLTESNVVWETLSSIDGDGQFVDSNFINVPPKLATCSSGSLPNPSEQQIDHDYLVALSLQEEQQRLEERDVVWQEYKEKQLGVSDNISDEELARRLQQEEQAQANHGATNASSQACSSSSTSVRSNENKKTKDCTIL